MSGASVVTQVGDGVYRVEQDGRAEVVYVAGQPDDPWAFWNGQVFRGSFGETPPAAPRPRAHRAVVQSLTAPMPATVVKVLVEPGDVVKKGDTIVILEAMKMELPLRASGDGTVKAVHCREGDLVRPDSVLVELA